MACLQWLLTGADGASMGPSLMFVCTRIGSKSCLFCFAIFTHIRVSNSWTLVILSRVSAAGVSFCWLDMLSWSWGINDVQESQHCRKATTTSLRSVCLFTERVWLFCPPDKSRSSCVVWFFCPLRAAMAEDVRKIVAFLVTYVEEIVSLQKPTLAAVLKSNRANQVKEWKAAKNFWERKRH